MPIVFAGKGSAVSTVTPLTLSGVSQYASDYQSILSRAVQIAQQPLTHLQTEDANVLAQNTALGSIQTAATNLFTSLQTLGKDATNQVLAASSSDPTKLTATATGATSPNIYTIDSVTTLATKASERSLQSYADSASTPVSSSPTLTLKLTVGTNSYTLNPSANTLTSLRDAINKSGAPVTASILTTSQGNYLSLSTNASGATTLQLIDDPVTAQNPTGANKELLTQTNQGTDAEFSLDGIDVKQSSNTVNSVIPGVTLRLLKTSGDATTVSLESNPAQLSTDLQSFVTNYNALEQALQAQQGTNGGALGGNLVVTQLQQTLRQITSFFTVTGSITNLGDLGVTFADNTGTVSFDQTAFNGLSSQQINDSFTFLSSLTTGTGNFTPRLQNFTDPVSGLIATEERGNTSTDQDLQARESRLADRINTLQTNLQLQLAKAQAQEAELQSQQQSVNASLIGLNFVLYGQNPTGN
jgi:flagellar hook-associated protein 2